ncbi:hypothetical protein WICMUC_004558 [Wickerhamomyces mucosus]|uniref:Nucleoporin NUP188 n=1 Tax=Wickerhamomyces mucosus TaxID=1378264 RepID=A0A9P8PHV4_9ASCO|nr:hypothetical protein WICMUC_004558 [Wickerhamomyces mucosus]
MSLTTINDNWSFDLILNLLPINSDQGRLDSIKKFLVQNIDLITNPLKYQESGIVPNGNTLELRGQSFRFNENNKKDTEEIFELIPLNKSEILRVISQTTQEKSSSISNDKNKSQDKSSISTTKYNNDDNDIKSIEKLSSIKNENRLESYLQTILNERIIILKIIKILLIDEDLLDKFSEKILNKQDYIPNLIESISAISDQILTFSGNKSSKYQDLIIHELGFTIIETLKVLISLLIKVSIPSSIVIKWFKLLESLQFWQLFQKKIDNEIYQEITKLSSIASILSLGLNIQIDDFDQQSSFFKDQEAITTINNILVDSPIDPIVLYSWSVILCSIDEEIISNVFGEDFDIDGYSRSFAYKSSDLNIFKYLEAIDQTLQYDQIYSAILSSFIISISPFLKLSNEISITISKILSHAPNSFVEKFFSNENVQDLIYLNKLKFPEVIIPYLRILSINGSYANNELSSLSTYMTILPSSSSSESIVSTSSSSTTVLSLSKLKYEQESVESDTISLTDGYYVNPPFESNKEVLIYLPPSTRGKLIPTADQNTDAIIFQYNYNGWSLLGRILQNITLFTDEDNEQQTLLLSTILELITNTLAVTDIDQTSNVLENLSSFIDDGDFIDLILKLFEQSLHQKNSTILAQLTKFLKALLKTYPQIVLAHLVRSDLLENRGRGGLISTILGSVETVSGNYEFTIETLKLFDDLVSISVGNIDEELKSYKSEILPKIVSFELQIFESFIYWNYKIPQEKFIIGELILNSFTKILNAVYTIDPETKPQYKITNVLESSAKRVITSFISSSSDVRVIKPISLGLDSLLVSFNSFDRSGELGKFFNEWIFKTLEFSKLVISIRSSIQQNSSPSSLEASLFGKVKTLFKIYIRYNSLRSPILNLLTALVSAESSNDSESNVNNPPSLLSHLGDSGIQLLISAISQDLSFKYDDFESKKSIYGFLSSVIQSNQKGLGMILLSGYGPHKAKIGEDSILNILKQNTQWLDYFPDWLGCHLIDVLAYALNSWSSKDVQDVKFVKTLIDKLINGDINQNHHLKDDNKEIINLCYQYKLNSRIAEICALIIFTSQSEDTVKLIFKEFENPGKLLNFIKPLYEPFNYKSSLHTNLIKNFESKWPSLKLSQFIRSPSSTPLAEFGEDKVYDLNLLDSVLGDTPYWNDNSGLTKGFKGQVISASVNLQLVSAQISSAKSWGALLAAYVKKNSIKTKNFIQIIQKLLEANNRDGLTISLFEETYRVRIELVFFFLYSIPKKDIDYESNKSILESVLQLIASADVGFLTNLSTNNPQIYRPLLRIIADCLRNAKGNPELVESLSGELLEFAELVIAKGTTVLFDAVQSCYDKPEVDDRIEDILLIISILKSLLLIKPSINFAAKLSTLLVDFNSLRSILNVYSSSHLIKVNEDPIFAELSLTYITELISTNVIAEQLISSGLFSILIQSPISVTIQEGSVFIQTSPRLHNIWSNGLLSIVLLLLSKFGVRLLPEISAFVSSFTKQFQSTINSWSQDSISITTPAIQETEQIIILEKALKSLYLEFGKANENLEIVPGLELSKSLANSLTHLLAHPKFLTSRVIPTTLEEQRLFEGDDKIRTPLVESLVEQINELKHSLEDNYL